LPKIAWRYVRLLGSLARYTLNREMAFRGNFLVKVSVEVLWLGILLAFYATVFARTKSVAGWPEAEYMFFVGCFFALNGMIETLFLENCNEFAELVRTGDLDFLLLRPIDEQFLITCRKFDWATAPNIPMGAAVMGIADGPTEVHKVTVARQVLRGYSPSDDLWPSEHIPRRLALAREKYAEYLEHEVGNQ